MVAEKIANSKITDKTIRLPVELDVPYAAPIVGFRPSRLPPLAEGFRGVSIGYIQTRNWADRVGLSIGDVITHVNGKAVTDMTMPHEFTDPMKTRPLHLTVEMAVNPQEISKILGEFNWSSRLYEVSQVRSAGSPGTNDMFERVFSNSSPSNEPSALFDYSKWIGLPNATVTQSVNESSSDEHSEQILIQSTPVVSPPPPPPDVEVQSVISSTPSAKPPSSSSSSQIAPKIATPKPPRVQKFKPESTKWIPKSPLTVSVVIHHGVALPDHAGTLGLDSMLQPFSSDPFMEVFLAIAPPNYAQMTLEAILECQPIESSAQTKSGICNSSQVWNHSATLSVDNSRLRVIDLILVGKLWDYRRLSAEKLMGVFAVPLNAVSVSDDGKSLDSQFLSLTSVDKCFDVTNSKIKISMFTHGVLKVIPGSPMPSSSVASSSKASPMTGASPLSQSGHESPIEAKSRTPFTIEPEVHVPTPFERALAQARADIRNGDFSPLRQQAYTLR